MDNLAKFQSSLKISFKNPELLKLALTHRSYLNENKQARESNERLEFLGDSVLSILVSRELYDRYPNYPEGKLTSLRSLLVRAKTLGELAEKLNYGQYLFMSHGEERTGGRKNQSLLADTFEAVLGAIYLDLGLETAKNFLETHLFPLISEISSQQNLLDFKSTLQELTQDKLKSSPEYKVISETGPDHEKEFSIGVYVGKKLLATGEGKSKQAAEQDAARLALEKGLEIS